MDEQLDRDITNYTNWLSQFIDCPDCEGVGCEECNETGTIKKQDNWWDE